MNVPTAVSPSCLSLHVGPLPWLPFPKWLVSQTAATLFPQTRISACDPPAVLLLGASRVFEFEYSRRPSRTKQNETKRTPVNGATAITIGDFQEAPPPAPTLSLSACLHAARPPRAPKPRPLSSYALYRHRRLFLAVVFSYPVVFPLPLAPPLSPVAFSLRRQLPRGLSHTSRLVSLRSRRPADLHSAVHPMRSGSPDRGSGVHAVSLPGPSPALAAGPAKLQPPSLLLRREMVRWGPRRHDIAVTVSHSPPFTRTLLFYPPWRRFLHIF